MARANDSNETNATGAMTALAELRWKCAERETKNRFSAESFRLDARKRHWCDDCNRGTPVEMRRGKAKRLTPR